MKLFILVLLFIINLSGCALKNENNNLESILNISFNDVKEIYVLNRTSSSKPEIDVLEANYYEFYETINVKYRINEYEVYLDELSSFETMQYRIVLKDNNKIHLYYIDGYFITGKYISIEQVAIDDKFLLSNLINQS